MTDEILVTGTLDFDPAKRDDVITAMLVMMEATQIEDGNISYTFSADLSDESRFYVVEQWQDEESIELHNASAHMVEFMSKMGDLGATGASVTAWIGATAKKLI